MRRFSLNLMAVMLLFGSAPVQAEDSDYWWGTVLFRTELIKRAEKTENVPSSGYEHIHQENIRTVTDTLAEFRPDGTVLLQIKGSHNSRDRMQTTNKVVCRDARSGQAIREQITTWRGSARDSTVEKHEGLYLNSPGETHYIVGPSVSLSVQGDLTGSKTDTLNHACGGSYSKSEPIKAWQLYFTQPIVGEGDLESPDSKVATGSTTRTDGTDEAKFTYTMSWDLWRGPQPKVEAVPSAPTAVERGATITFDGSKSRGKIERYTWKFSPGEGCPEGLLPVVREGKTLSFKLLCPLNATLTVRGEGTQDQRTIMVGITPRQWKTAFSQGPEKTFSEPIWHDWGFYGKNRCHIDEAEPNHWLHRPSKEWTWEGDGYTLASIADENSPFNGVWFVEKANLRIDRQTAVNANLLPGTEFQKVNAAKGTSVDALRRLKQVREHEKTHGLLVKELLETRFSGDEDPEMGIEGFLSLDQDQLKLRADVAIGEVETALVDVSSEANVRERLRKDSDLNRPGKIYLQHRETKEWVEVKIVNFADI